MRACGFVITG